MTASTVKTACTLLLSAMLLVLVWWGTPAAAAEPPARPQAPAGKKADPPKPKAAEEPKAQAAVIDAAKYANLQAAFDAVPEAGGLVKLPPGDFKLTTPLILSRGNTRVKGAGAATCLVNCNAKGQPALIVRPKNRARDRRARIWRVQLADFRICGDPASVDAKSTKPKSGDGLLAEGVNELYLHGLSVDHNGAHGVNLVDCTEDPRISDCILTYNRQAGLNIQAGHDIVVSANHFEENQDALRCTDSYNLCMSGNNLDDHLGCGVVIENTYGSVLAGNMIEECKGTAVVLDRDCYGITLSANVIAHNFGGGVDLRDAWGCAVSANTFVVNGTFSLVVGPGSGRITITGNNFCDNWIGGKAKAFKSPATAILLKGASDIVISGNSFTGMDRQAIEADEQCRRIAITGNITAHLNRKTDKKLPPLDLRGAKEVLGADNITDQASQPKPK